MLSEKNQYLVEQYSYYLRCTEKEALNELVTIASRDHQGFQRYLKEKADLFTSMKLPCENK